MRIPKFIDPHPSAPSLTEDVTSGYPIVQGFPADRGFSSDEDPYADELAQRSAEYARHAAFEANNFNDPTPPHGTPEIASTVGSDQGDGWAPQLFAELPTELTDPPLPDAPADPPLAAAAEAATRLHHLADRRPNTPGAAHGEHASADRPPTTPPTNHADRAAANHADRAAADRTGHAAADRTGQVSADRPEHAATNHADQAATNHAGHGATNHAGHGAVNHAGHGAADRGEHVSGDRAGHLSGDRAPGGPAASRGEPLIGGDSRGRLPEEPDPRVAADRDGLGLGARFGMAFSELPSTVDPPVNPPAPPPPATLQPSLAVPKQTDIVDGPDETGAVELEAPDDLPQRVPAAPDVPPADLTEPEPEIAQTAVSRIASHLRRDDVPALEQPDEFDVDAVLKAVRGMAGIRNATLRRTANGANHLRLDLTEGADPSAISRMVARMLQERMGIDAAPAETPGVPPNIAAPAMTPPTPPAATSPAATPGVPVEPPPPAAPTPAAAAENVAPRIPGQNPVPSVPTTLPAPRIGAGATPPTQAEPSPSAPVDVPARESRRRHPVNVPRRSPSELRPVDGLSRPRPNADNDPPALASSPPLPTDREQGPRAIIEHVQTSTFGLDATVEVRLTYGDINTKHTGVGVASGPAVDAYILRLCASAAAAAIDDLLREGTTTGDPGRCFIEQATIVPMGSCDVAVVVVLLVCGGWVEQLAGSALVSGDPRRAIVRATLSSVNRRLAALLP